MVNEDIRFEAADVICVEAFAKEVWGEISWRAEFYRQFILIIATRVEARGRIKGTKVRMAADVVPMRVGEKDRCQWWQTGRVRSQSSLRRCGELSGAR